MFHQCLQAKFSGTKYLEVPKVYTSENKAKNPKQRPWNIRMFYSLFLTLKNCVHACFENLVFNLELENTY